MTNRMAGSVLTLLTLLFSAGGGAAQTYTQMQWGMNKGVTPYAFGANINGTWRDLGTVSAAGVWSIPSTYSAFLQYNWLTGAAFTSAVSYPVAAKLGQYISVADFGAVGDGVTDDAPAFRAAYNACITGKFRRVWIPSPRVGYIFKSLHSSGLGVLVIGDGTNSVSCSFEGEAVNTAQFGFDGGVSLKLGAGLNRPMIYVRKEAGSPVFKNLRMDFAGYDQTGCTTVSGVPDNGCPQGGRLWGIVIEDITDGDLFPESAIKLEHVNGQFGYNGNLYLGNGRGALECQYCYFLYGGQNTTDYSVFFNGYDVIIQGGGIGSHNGYGLYINQGSQYQISNMAIWMNNVGEYIRNGIYTQHVNMNYQANKTFGLIVDGSAYVPAPDTVRSHTFTNATFDSNNATLAGTASDIQIIADTSTQFSNVAFNGATFPVTGSTFVKPVNNINFSGVGSQARIGTPRYVDGTSNTSGFTNAPTQLVTDQPGIFNSRNGVRVTSADQFSGFAILNGPNTVAAIQGTSVTNDNGWMYVSSGGVAKAIMNSAGVSYFNGGNVAIGSTSASYPLDVTGDINTSGGYRINGVRSIAGTAPTISSGFGTSPSVTVNNGTSAFRINVGTGGTATNGVVGLPTAANGWNCFASDITTPATGHTIKQTATSTTSVTLTNYDNAGVAAAWAAGDIIIVNCMAY
jgi:hypothetical protein